MSVILSFILIVSTAFFSGCASIGTDAANRDPANTSGNSAQSQERLNQFIDITGLAPGEYVLTSGPKVCQQGELRITQYEQEIIVHLGANPLVIGLGRESFTEGCSTISSSYGQGYFEGTKETTCGGIGAHTYEVKAQINGPELRYQRRIKKGADVVRKEDCVLVRE